MPLTEDLISETEFEQVSDLVYQHCGINLHDGKMELVRARLAKQMRLGGFRTASEYLQWVHADQSGQRFTELIDSMSTNLTSFFRENQHFVFLAQQLLPQIMQRKQSHRRIRAWSAGCSTGEEPYSIAMTLLEALDPQQWDVKLLATDISTRVLRIAKEGLYEKSRVEAVSPQLRSRYLSANRMEGKTVYQAGESIKKIIQFSYLNLMEPWPFAGPFDFIFCRNVMIYFDKPTQQKLVNRFWDVLDRGGMLFTGHSESLTGIQHRFRYVQPTIYVKN